jgi:hypothetical protein
VLRPSTIHTTLYQQGETQGVPLLILHEKIQHRQFTDRIVVNPQYPLGKNRRQFAVDELKQLLEEAGVQATPRAPERSV